MLKMSRRIKTITICMIAALLVAGFASACARSDSVSSDEVVRRDVTVETITPEMGSIIVPGEYIGTTEPNQRLMVYPKMPGEVLTVHFSVGDTVEEGDVLFTMNATDILNSIKSLEAQLAIQDATVNSAQTGVSLSGGSAVQGQILSASGGVQQAEAAVTQAGINAEQALLAVGQREMALEQATLAYDAALQSYNGALLFYELGDISKDTLDQAERGLANAEITVNQAVSVLEQTRNSYDLALTAVSQAQRGYEQALRALGVMEQMPSENRQRAQDALAQAEAARDSLLVNIETAMERLDDVTIRAPISGVVDGRTIDPLSMASPQSPAFIISDTAVITVTFRIPRSSVEHLEVGGAITIQDRGSEYPGTIEEISTTVNAVGLFTIKAHVDGSAASIPGGSSVIVVATAQKAENVPIVPLSVVHYESGTPFVYLAENGFAKKVQVEIGVFDEQNIQILSGVEIGSQIISTWSSRLSDGVELVFAGRGSAE